jgi:transcriptional regulator with XRE-family HTH domain
MGAKPQTQAVSRVKGRFAENLILLRSRVGLSQGKTALRAGLHLTEISLLERGLRLPRLDTIVKLAGAVEVEPCELLARMAWRPESDIGRAGAYVQDGRERAESSQ